MSAHHRRLSAASATIMLALFVACSSGTTPTRVPATSSSPPPPTDSASPEAAPRPSPSGSPAPERDPLTIALAGDVHFEGALRDRLDNPATALAPTSSALSAADVAVVNLETSVGSGGQPAPGKRFLFQAPPTAFTALAAAGVDVASMANNHALDFGRGPLPGTFEAIEAVASAEPALAVVGLGRNAQEAFRPARTDVRGTIVATIGATVADNDPTADPTGQWAATSDTAGTADAIEPDRLLRAVARADRSADVVVVYLHWGVQGERCPSDTQRSLAADLVAAGADIVAGSHTHRLQGDGRLGQGYVVYGLGNYAWYTQDAQTSVTGVLTLTVQPPRSRAGRVKVTDAVWQPARIAPDGLPRPVSGSAAADFRSDRGDLRECAGLRP